VVSGGGARIVPKTELDAVMAADAHAGGGSGDDALHEPIAAEVGH
jgi:hypothetical protein